MYYKSIIYSTQYTPKLSFLYNAGVGADVSSHSVSLQKVIPLLLLLHLS